jgi:large subunit ribosomal protein L17
MRHGDKIKNLGRTQSHRMALMCNLTSQLIQYKRITTTLAKAKSLRVFAEPIITRCKEDTMHNRRIVFSYLQDKESIKELFGVISDKVADRPGGYTRIIKLPRRMGDAADMAMIELVDFNEIYGKDAEAAAAKKTRRSRRGAGAKKATDTTATAAPVHTEEPTAHVVEEPIAHVAEEVAPHVEAATEEATHTTEETIVPHIDVPADAPSAPTATEEIGGEA